MAGPLRGGGGVKGRPLRKKKLFSELFFKFYCQKNTKNRAILIQKVGEEKKLSKFVSGYLKTTKFCLKNSYGH